MALMRISDIKANPNNPRIIKDDKFKKLVESVKSFPEMLELRPIVVNKDMIILWGNMRYKACKEAWLKEIPVIVADNLTEEQESEFLIKDNVSGGEWDWNLLANEWDKEELEEWGLDVQFETVEPEAEEDDFEVDEGVKTDIVLWDLFEIWPHRLLCWDSTNIDDVNKLMNGEKADMVFTDPPYRLETEWGETWLTWKALWKQGRDIAFISDFEPTDFLNILPILFNKNHNSYLFCNKDLLPDYLKWAVDNNISFNVLIWKKPTAIPIADSHRPDIEYLLLFRKNAIWNNSLKDVNYSRCLEYWRERGLHPTMKPIELIANELKISSHDWSIVVDCFWWSGSTMVACHQLNRKCYMSELDPKYVQTIINRMIKLEPTIEIKRNWIHYETVISE